MPTPHDVASPRHLGKSTAKRARPFTMRQMSGGIARHEGQRYAYEVRCIENPSRSNAVFEATVKLRRSGIVVSKAIFNTKEHSVGWCEAQRTAREA